MQDIPTANIMLNTPGKSLGAEGHFRLYLYAVVTKILTHLHAMEAGKQRLEQFPFLENYAALVRIFLPDELPSGAESSWWATYIAQREAQTSEPLPLRSLVQEASLSMHEVEMVVAAGIVEEDIRFGAFFAALQEPQTGHRPCLGLLNWLLSEPEEGYTDIWPLCRKLLDAGLLHVDNRTDPRAQWLLRVHPVIWDALRGYTVTQPAPSLSLLQAEGFPQLQDLILPPSLHDRILHLPDLLIRGNLTAIVLRGMHGTGRRTTLGAVARTLNRSVLLWEGGKPGDDAWSLLGPLATLSGAMPLLRFEPGPGETIDLPPLPGYRGPVGITLGPTGGLRGPLVAHALNFNLPAPDHEARSRFWQSAHLPASSETLDSIATRFLLTGGHIAKAAPLAQAFAVLDGRSEITTTDVQQATRTLSRQALETLATAMEPTQGSDLIVSVSVAQELCTLEIRCQHRELLLTQSGPAFRQSLNRGVRALFSGPSGTGKTLAARTLAAALQMDLYRVDLAAVVSKYIGETERNLNLVLSRAEELDVMLLLDEGDALMTGRTDVRSSNDRYANLETNYLLQRLENYEGIIVITTNAGNRIDSAFSRRIDFVINFVPPEAHERWLIWQCHLPQPHAVSTLLLEEIASRCALTGGQIRNAALHATLLALGNADQVNDGHVETAIQREYRKAGAACPLPSKREHKAR